jgi:ApeA N-terminal domain 1
VSEGLFWSARGGVRVQGDFTVEDGRSAEVTLAGAIADDPRILVENTAPCAAVTFGWADLAKDVAAFAPMDLHGQLDSGELVSLLAAQNHDGPSAPRYVARVALLGAHVSDGQLYSAVRFRIDHPCWTAHLADGENHTVSDDSSVLRAVAPAERPDEGIWLVYECAHPYSLQDLEIRVLGSCRALARLAFDLPLVIRTVEVRVNEDGEWLRLHSQAYSAAVSGPGESLLSREELTVERFANWIELNGKLDGLASAVYELGIGALQSQVLLGTSLIEGLHRRLSYEQTQFPNASGGARERVKQAARHAAVKQAEEGNLKVTVEKRMDPDKVYKAVMESVSHFDDVGYRTRVQDIINKVTSAVPELAESVPELAEQLTNARNELAHRLPLNDEKEPLADRINRWTVVSIVTPWLLRLLLLLHAEIEQDVLHTACLGSVRFAFARANVADIARDLGWPPAADSSV